MHICTIDMSQAWMVSYWYLYISNTKSKPENIHYPLQPYQKSPPLQSWIKKTWGLTFWHAYNIIYMQIMSLRSPMNAQTSGLADEKIDIHGENSKKKKQPSKNPGIGIEWNWHHVDIKKATSASAKDFLNTFLPASDSRPSEPFQSANFETPFNLQLWKHVSGNVMSWEYNS